MFTTKSGAFFVESNGEEPVCPVCGGRLKYRDQVPRIMRKYGGDTSYVMIDRRKCQNPACGKLHRCLPSQLTRFKHFLTEVIEDTVDEVYMPDASAEFVESPDSRTAALWKKWVEHNVPYINGYLKTVGHSILGVTRHALSGGNGELISVNLPFRSRRIGACRTL